MGRLTIAFMYAVLPVCRTDNEKGFPSSKSAKLSKIPRILTENRKMYKQNVVIAKVLQVLRS